MFSSNIITNNMTKDLKNVALILAIYSTTNNSQQ